MVGQCLVGVDIGTQGVKAAVFQADGTMAGSGFQPSELIQPEPGITEESPQTQYENVCQALKTAVQSGSTDPADVAAIALDGQMAGVIGIGADGAAVTPYDSWLDTRCGPYIKEMRRAGQVEVTRLTGNAPSFNHGPKVLWWKHERPDAYQRIARFVQPTGYVALRLTGGDADQAFIDTTYLHFSGFADNAQAVWSDDLLDLFDVEADRMPRIVRPTDIVGEVTPAAAADTGLRAGTPVVAGCGDTAASFLAAGAVQPGNCVDVSGTASVFAATTTLLRPDTVDGMLGVGQSAVPGLWHPYAYVNGGGMNLEWFRGLLKTVRDADVDFDELNRLAAEIGQAASAPLFIPHMAGRVSPSDPDLRGAWLGLDWTHTPGHLFRAILESIALEYRLYKERLTTLNPDETVRTLRNTGGGNTSDLWKQIKADALGVGVVDVPDFAGATLGVAMVAGVGAGILPSLQEAAPRWVRTGAVTEPRTTMRAHYETRMSQYQAALEAVQRLGQDAMGVS